ncbi:restriction endonuclease subunit S [Paratractidigestivibacter faecalis]|uniref:Restriction endonuclease subunit S n=1 Tax=Paratractidigestivibacter faecalis TaxID=2292441 RepID=A0ABV1IG03_9ACTN
MRAQFDALEQTSNWRSERTSELFEIGIGKTPPRKEPEWFSTNPRGNFVWLSIKDMGEPGAYSFDSSEYLTPQAVVAKNVRRVPKGSVLLSFKLTVGRVKIAAVDMTTNEAIACFASDDPAKLAYLYPFLLSFDYNGLGSTSSIATAVNSKTIKNMTIVMPDSNTLAEFYANTKPLYEAIMNSMLENMSLKALRDALLPKLMSGEIDVTQLNSHLTASSHGLPGHLTGPSARVARRKIKSPAQVISCIGILVAFSKSRQRASSLAIRQRLCRTSPLPKNR